MAFFRVLLLVGCLSGSAMAQSNFIYPNFFSAYFQNFSQITPASIPDETKAEFNCGYKSMTGAFRKVSGFFATGSRSFVTQKDNVHLIRLQFYNEKEGSYITSPRVYANYAYQLKLSETLAAYAGVAAGAVTTYYSAPTTTQTSYTLPDASLGVGLKSGWMDIGASMMQALNTAFIPVQSVTQYHRFYHVHGMVQHEWPSEWGLRGRFLWRHLPSLPEELLGSGSVFYTKRLELGSTLSTYNGLSIFAMAGIANAEDRLNIMLNYNSSFLALVPAWQGSMEIGLAYFIR